MQVKLVSKNPIWVKEIIDGSTEYVNVCTLQSKVRKQVSLKFNNIYIN